MGIARLASPGKGQLEEHEFFGFMRKVKEREAMIRNVATFLLRVWVCDIEGPFPAFCFVFQVGILFLPSVARISAAND